MKQILSFFMAWMLSCLSVQDVIIFHGANVIIFEGLEVLFSRVGDVIIFHYVNVIIFDGPDVINFKCVADITIFQV
jgi:hypothetical protein